MNIDSIRQGDFQDNRRTQSSKVTLHVAGERPVVTFKRDSTIDIAKGIAIVAIVLGHVIRGLASSGMINGGGTLVSYVDSFLYMFHLSVFAFLSAIFVSRSVGREGVHRYLRSRDATFFYLYIVWSLLQGVVKILTSSFVNSPMTVTDMFTFWVPEGQLWFLPWLIVMTTMAASIRPWRSRIASIVTLLVAGIVSVLFWGINGPVAGTQGLGLTFFYFCGLIWGFDRFLPFLRKFSRTSTAALALLGTFVFTSLVLLTEAVPPASSVLERPPLAILLGFIASWVGVFSVFLIARLMDSWVRMFSWLAFIGQRTLEIFLAHIMATSGVRIILSVAGVETVWIHVLAGTITGVTFPLLLWWTLSRIRFPWLFVAPPIVSSRRLEKIRRSELRSR